MQIITNIYQEISDNEKKTIKRYFAPIKNVDILPYAVKGITSKEVITFIFSNINLFTIIRDGLIFEAFLTGVKKLWRYVHNKKKYKLKVQWWIKLDSSTVLLDIFLPDNKLEESLNSLPVIIKNIEKEKKARFLITYEKDHWKISKR